MSKIRVAVMGYGHIGCAAIEGVRRAPDMELAGVITRRVDEVCAAVADAPVVPGVPELSPKPDVVILGVPTRKVEETAPKLLEAGIRTVDSFDMHGEPFARLRASLGPAAKRGDSVAVMSSGVDPGVDTMIRAIFEMWAPTGLTYVSYGPGMSMGHTVAAKSYAGVRDALSITRPGDPGCHKRDLYLEMEPGADFETVKGAILADPYFSHDDVRVFQVEDVTPLVDTGHRIHVFRKGASSGFDNQLLTFDAVFNNPPSTAQVLVASARASMRLAPGAYTLLEVPLLYFLPGDPDTLLKRLV